MVARTVRPLIAVALLSGTGVASLDGGQSRGTGGTASPTIPRTWDEQALADLEVPLADPRRSPRDISAEAYYRIPVRPIYKSYPLYQVDKEPRGYRDRLRRLAPIVLWDDGAHRPRLDTEADWIKAGEMVFNAPVLFTPATSTPEERRTFDAATGDIYDKKGHSPFAAYVVRKRGTIETAEEIEAIHLAIPPGVFARQGTSPFSPAKLPDLIGIKERRYLDATGLVQHRSIGDLMRYAALNQGMDMLASFGDFRPAGAADNEQANSPYASFAKARYSDEQLYALALHLLTETAAEPSPANAGGGARRSGVQP